MKLWHIFAIGLTLFLLSIFGTIFICTSIINEIDEHGGPAKYLGESVREFDEARENKKDTDK